MAPLNGRQHMQFNCFSFWVWVCESVDSFRSPFIPSDAFTIELCALFSHCSPILRANATTAEAPDTRIYILQYVLLFFNAVIGARAHARSHAKFTCLRIHYFNLNIYNSFNVKLFISLASICVFFPARRFFSFFAALFCFFYFIPRSAECRHQSFTENNSFGSRFST